MNIIRKAGYILKKNKREKLLDEILYLESVEAELEKSRELGGDYEQLKAFDFNAAQDRKSVV